MKKIRILVLSHMYPKITDPVNGVFIHEQIKTLSKMGHQIKVISPIPLTPRILQTNPRRRAYRQTPLFDLLDGIPVYYPRYLRLPGQWFHGPSCYTMYLGIYNAVKKMIRDFKPNILHTHTATPDGYVGLILRNNIHLPFICSLRGSDINIYPYQDLLTLRLTKKVISYANQLITVSNALKIEAEKIAIPKREIQVIYNGCNIKKFTLNIESRITIRKQLNIPADHIILIFIGHLIIEKGIRELIESFIALSLKNQNLHLIIIGDGPEKYFLAQRIFQAKLQKKCHLIGQQLHDKIPDLLNASDILILPTYNEGLPNVIMEAMACSLPVITTRVGGIPEIVKNGKTGILINKKDALSLRGSILKLIQNKQERVKMGVNGRKIIEQKFTQEQGAKRIEEIYEKFIK